MSFHPASGIWWLADDQDRPLPGTLRREGDRWVLDLIGRHEVDLDRLYRPGTFFSETFTIHGACLGRRYTLLSATLDGGGGPTLFPQRDPHEFDNADHQHTQTWRSAQLLEGDWTFPDDTFGALSFGVIGMREWWAEPTRSPHPSPIESVDCTLADGSLSITTAEAETFGIYRHQIERDVRLMFAPIIPMTFERMQEVVVQPISALISATLNLPSGATNLTLYRESHRQRGATPVTLNPGVGTDLPKLGNPYLLTALTAAAIGAESVIAGWIDLAKRAPFAVYAAVAEELGNAEAEVVQLITAAETLHRLLQPSMPKAEDDLADRVVHLMTSERGFRSKDRQRAKRALRTSEISLEQRLGQLGADMGDDFASWYFDGKVKDWAFVAAETRNALAHGYATAHGLERDHRVVIGLLVVVRAFLRLRLLHEAGATIDANVVSRDHRLMQVASQRLIDWASVAAEMRVAKEATREQDA